MLTPEAAQSRAAALIDLARKAGADAADAIYSGSMSEGVQVRSFQLAIERLRARPSLAPILIHKPGPLFDESPPRQAALAEVYRRGLEEVGALLAGVRTHPG